MTDIDQARIAAEAVEDRWLTDLMDRYGDVMAGYLTFVHDEGLLVPEGGDSTAAVAGDGDRGHDELVDAYFATLPGEADPTAPDMVLEMSVALDQCGMMLTDSTRRADPGVDTRDWRAFVADYFVDRAIGEAERRAERCCSKC